MHKALGRFKGILMLILLMLIATRLTWLQTTDSKVDLSSTFYRTGLWVNERASHLCKETPEATFPLPPEIAISANSQPPPPALGELSPGLALIMIARCQWVRLETENLAAWNTWLFMGATLFSAMAVRLLTNSWTAGLLAAVAVLSRGTLQNRALLAATEPYAAPFAAAAWCFTIAFLRSLWRPWIGYAAAAWVMAILFVPALWSSLVIVSLLFLGCVRFGRREDTAPFYPGATDRAVYLSLRDTYPNRFWYRSVALGLLLALALGITMAKLMPGSLPTGTLLYGFAKGRASVQVLLGSLRSMPELIGIHSPDIDWHAWLTVALIMVQPFTGGKFGAMNRAAAVAFGSVLALQIFASFWQECYFIHSTTQAHPAAVPAARAMEPIFIAWGTGSAWRVLDLFTGYRLSTSGWSIRGRDRMDPTN